MTSKTTLLPGRAPANGAEMRYDHLSIILHWLTAGLVIVQFLLAEFWGFFPRPGHHAMIVMHMSFGLLLTLLLVIRIMWRLSIRQKMHVGPKTSLDVAAHIGHLLLYALLLSQVILGIMLRWTDNQPLSFFGLQIPTPFGTFAKTTGDTVDQIHDVMAWVIIIIATGHAIVAVFHHFVWRDGVLRRMLPFLKN